MEITINSGRVIKSIIFCLMVTAILLAIYVLDQYLSQQLRSGINLNNSLSVIKQIMLEDYIQTNLYNNPKYNGQKLNKNEFQVFSQAGEDGIIEEIFNRIGSKTNYFVEFGAEDGSENNTVYLLMKGEGLMDRMR